MKSWLAFTLLALSSSAQAASTLPIEQVILGHTGWVTGAALSPSGKQAALVSRSTVYLTDLNSRQQTALSGHTGPVTSLTYAPEGSVLFTGGNDGTLKRWSAATGQRLSSLQACGVMKDRPEYHVPLTTITARSESDFVVICGGELQVWRGGKQVRTLPGTLAAYSADGKQLVVATGEKPLKIYDAESFKVLATLALPKLAQPIDVFTTPGAPSAVSFSPDGQHVAVAFRDSMPKVENFRAAVYDATSGQLLFELGEPHDYVQELRFSPDGKQLLTTGRSSAKLYDATDGHLIRLLQPPNTRIGVQAVAWLPGAEKVMAASVQNGAEILDLKGGVLARYRAPADMATAVAWNPTGTLLATGAMDGRIQLWKGQHLTAEWQAHTGLDKGILGLNSLAFSPDGTRLVSTGQDSSVRFWTAAGQKLSEVNQQSNAVDFPQFSADGQRLVFGESVGLRMIDVPKFLKKPRWDLQSLNTAVAKLGGGNKYNDPAVWQKLTSGAFWNFKQSPGGSTYALCLMPDGRTVRELSAHTSGTALTQYDSLTGKQFQKVLPYSKFDNLYTASFSPDCGRFAFGRVGGRTEVWQMDKGLNLKQAGTFAGAGRIYRTKFSPDGHLLAVNRGESLNVFNLKTGQESGSYRGLSANSYAMAFNPAGTLLAVGSGTTERGGTVTVFRVGR